MNSHALMSFSEAWLQGPQQTQFYTRQYTPQTEPIAALVFLHGFAEHIGRYTSFHSKLAERSLLVFAFDQRGFGKTATDKEHKSSSSSYGKTSWNEHLTDTTWAIEHVTQKYPSLYIYLAGHSMGGGLVLGFGTPSEDSSHLASVSSIIGVIAMSPLIQPTKPPAKPIRTIGGALSKVMPNFLFPTDVDPKALSRDPKIAEEYEKDPLVRTQGSLRGLNDMLTQGELLLSTNYANWFKLVPLLLLHGTADRVTSFSATKAFYNKLDVHHKKLVPFQDAFHELYNEIDGIPDKVMDEIMAFVREHTPVRYKPRM
ncbi:hypothetical protein APHAL10511_004720 [Amanita phalloides]|nr:hypothetical protein APHAL10511_004720 [Amanita phalloides]